MTNTEIIQAIKAEIERRHAEWQALSDKGNISVDGLGAKFEDENILSFLSTLESVNLADARKTSPKGLEEAAREYGFEEYRRRCNGDEYGTSEDAFIAGAKWMEEQLKK